MEKVLLIDNDAQQTEMMAKWLRSKGYELNTMYSHKGLLGKVYEFNPSIILMGISLHGTDGRHFCSLLKNIDKTRHIKIIIISPSYSQDNIDDYEWCADDFLYGPHSQEKLLDTVRGVLNKQVNS